MLSPFDLRGPEFLLFYLVFGACVLAVLFLLRYTGEASDPPQVDLSDPYLIAFLRGGQNETLRVATVSLIDRGFLQVAANKVSVVQGQSSDTLRIPLERHLFTYFSSPAEAIAVFKAREFDADMAGYEGELARLDLLPGAQVKIARGARLALALSVLWGVAIVKLFVALARGRSNIGFLIILAIAFGLAAARVARPRLTQRGAAMVSGLRTLFGGLKDRASLLQPRETASEVLLLAAVFGVGAIPATVFPHVQALYPRASSSSSSVCGSSCGSSCGSGCGGGGCGGGCGGCGS